MAPKEFMWGEQLTLALLPQVRKWGCLACREPVILMAHLFAVRQRSCTSCLQAACLTLVTCLPCLGNSLGAAGGARGQRAHAMARQEPHLHCRHGGVHYRKPARQDARERGCRACSFLVMECEWPC